MTEKTKWIISKLAVILLVLISGIIYAVYFPVVDKEIAIIDTSEPVSAQATVLPQEDSLHQVTAFPQADILHQVTAFPQADSLQQATASPQTVSSPPSDTTLQKKSSPEITEETVGKTKKININVAGIEELTQLSGIGETKAQSILDYRNSIGLFQSIEEIMKVSGIKEGAFKKIKDNITVE